MKKTLISTILSLILVLGLFVVPGNGTFKAEAATPSKASVSDLQDDLEDVEKEQKQVKNQLSQVASEIKSMQNTVDNLSAQITKTAEKIEKTEKQIKKKQKEIEEREANLNQRLVVMYKNGSIGFVDVLLGSSSISEFVSNLQMIKLIYQNDVNILTVLQQEHDELQDKKAELKETKANLKEKQEELKQEKIKLKEKKAELEKKEDELNAQADALVAEILTMIDTSSKYIGGTFLWPCPTSRYITSSFGNRLHPVLKYWKFHTGVDIGAPGGDPIVAAGAGRVIKAAVYGGYGNCIIVDHGGGIVTLYGHCQKMLVSQGDIVTKGQQIGKVGMTGTATGNHLHFEVRVNGEYVNPMKYY